MGAAARGLRRRARRPVPGRPRPGRAAVQLGQPRRRRRHRHLGDRQRRLQRLRRQLRLLRQDLRRDRRRHRADAVALPDLLPGAARARRSTPRPSTRPPHDTTEGEPRPMGARDAEMADTLPELTGADRRATATRPASSDAQRTWDGHERRLHDLDGLRPAADVDGQLRPSPTPAAASISARPMPVRRLGENVPLVTSPTAAAGGVQHRHARSRDAPPGRPQAPQQPARARLLLREQRLPAPERRLLPAHGPAAARLVGRDVQRQLVAVQRVAHLGAERVPRPEPAGTDAEVLPRTPGRRPRARPPGRRRPAARSRARRCSRCGRRSPRRRRARRCRSRTTCRAARPAARAAPGPAASAVPARRGRRPRRAGR